MNLPQNAENVKKAIESIINEYEFDKSKISAVVIGEGKNLLRLFKNDEHALYIHENESEQNNNNNDDDDSNEKDESNGEDINSDESDEVINEIKENVFENPIEYAIRSFENELDEFNEKRSVNYKSKT
jgi:hypothetical protein